MLINIERDKADRMSKNLKNIAVAYNIFLPDHFNVIDEYPALHIKLYYESMWLNFHLSDADKAKQYYAMKVGAITSIYKWPENYIN